MFASLKAVVLSAVRTQVEKVQSAKQKIFAEVYLDDEQPTFMINPL